MSESVRVVVADDHHIVREGLVALLGAIDGIEVVGSAEVGADAVAVVSETLPDVVVMDIQMPELDGIAATRAIVEEHPGVAVVMLTMNEDDDTIMGALRAGARGYLLKGADAGEVTHAIKSAAGGGMVFGAALAARIATFLAGGSGRRDVVFPELTDRERDVLDQIAAGRSNAEIARSSYLSDKTVRNVVSSIYTKLHAADRAAAIIMARDAGLGRGKDDS
jgi:DNA-binding NarL/FixJ family response regulator